MVAVLLICLYFYCCPTLPVFPYMFPSLSFSGVVFFSFFLISVAVTSLLSIYLRWLSRFVSSLYIFSCAQTLCPVQVLGCVLSPVID